MNYDSFYKKPSRQKRTADERRNIRNIVLFVSAMALLGAIAGFIIVAILRAS